MGLPLSTFAHYSFLAGENTGQPSTAKKSYELDRSLNVEYRGKGISTRFGSLVLNVDGDTLPNPISGNKNIVSIYGHSSFFGNETFFVNGTLLYKEPTNPTVVLSNITENAPWQWQSAGDIMYAMNPTDGAFFYDPSRSTTAMYPCGYPTPSAFTATPATSGGSMADGAYSYYVKLYDEDTLTKSNPQAALVTATVSGGGGSGKVTLDSLPLDAASRSSHWLVYRKDPTGYYYYFRAKIPYNGASPSWVDTAAATGTREIMTTDDFAPDASAGLCLHGSVMVYFTGNQFMWSKSSSYQNVPTLNMDYLDDNSAEITRAVSYQNALVIFKTNSIYVLTGSLTKSTYSIRCISRNVGCNSPNSVVASTYGIFFLDSMGKVRLLTSTDFSTDDLRDSTDISYYYREKLAKITPSVYPNCFAVFYENREVKQYRLFCPVEITTGECDHCYVYDYSLGLIEGMRSNWFDFKIGQQLVCATTRLDNTNGAVIHGGDNYGLLWELNSRNAYYDGDQEYRIEDDGTVTYPTGSSLKIDPSPSWAVDRFVGLKCTLFDAFTFTPFFESKILSNTADTLTFADSIVSPPTTNPCVSIGGYSVYFATANFSRNLVGRNKPYKFEAIFDSGLNADELKMFFNYDFMLPFNYTTKYFNDPTLSSFSSLCDTYDITIGVYTAVYDTAIYDVDSYNYSEYGFVNSLMKNTFLFKTVSWGVVSRLPGTAFSYLGATMYYQNKGSLFL